MKKPITILILLLFSIQIFAQTKAQFKKQVKNAIEDLRKEKQTNVYAFDAFCKAIPAESKFSQIKNHLINS